MIKVIPLVLLLSIQWHTFAQLRSENIHKISIQDDEDFTGYEHLQLEGVRLFALGEHWHNIKRVPEATLKLLKYLHQHAEVNVLAIEQGKSVAWIINTYLTTGDESMLSHLTRNTMFWAKEHRTFFRDLRDYNLTVEPKDRITVQSIDIEYKMESAIFVINQFIKDKPIPQKLSPTLGAFKKIYEDTQSEREAYDGIAVLFYYDRDYVSLLVNQSIEDIEAHSQRYIDFLGEDFEAFATMILEMDDGLTFDYTNANQHYKFRDEIIYFNFLDLLDDPATRGILCPIGMRHVEKGSSIYDLNKDAASPLYDQVKTIRISALFAKSFHSADLKKINYNYPDQLKVNPATLIYHHDEDPYLKSKKYDYTLFINENGSLTPFERVLTESY